MKNRIMIGAVGLAALLGMGAPAFGQYYPQPQPHPQPGGITGAIINQVTGYGRYPYGNYGYNTYGREAYLIDQCARAVEARLNNYRSDWYRGANYNRYRNHGRVEGITRVERRSNGGLKVWGVASSGYGGYQGWNRPGYGSYGYNAGADLKWDCKVKRTGQVSNLDVDRRPYNWRGY
jgi:hypothetical protein